MNLLPLLLSRLTLLRCLALLVLMLGVSVSALAAKTYSDNGDGTVTDPTTGLVWMRCAMGQTWDGTTCTGTAGTYTIYAANALTGKVTFAGRSDWRLPNIRELQTIVDRSVFNPDIDKAAFPNTSSYFWSASASAGVSSGVWGIDFGFTNIRFPDPVGKLFGTLFFQLSLDCRPPGLFSKTSHNPLIWLLNFDYWTIGSTQTK